MYVGIDAKIMQIWAAQLTLNNVSDSQVLGDLLNQIQLDKRIDSAYIDGAYYTKYCIQGVKHMLLFHNGKMRNLGKISKQYL